ncbi:hypothetical protein [Chelativorans sp. J32]|uniref:hypothetical protein n=1 Tax=Chelativorans sp. J32 TaxID=935840 RepID=UPI000484A72B|nr:hypothetical protein [Chelativorans sp. J32]
MAGAFDKRQREDGLWEVYDEDSEEVIVIDGLPLSGLDEDEADDALRGLRAGEISPDTSPEMP